MSKIQKSTLSALLIALSFVLSHFKIMGSVAFDSLPAFLAGLWIGPLCAAAIAIISHLLTAILSGFPFGILVHGIVAGMMAITVYVFAVLYRALAKHVSSTMAALIAGCVGVFLNGPCSIFVLQPLLLPILGIAGLYTLLIALSVAACLNILFAIIVFHFLKKRFQWSDRER